MAGLQYGQKTVLRFTHTSFTISPELLYKLASIILLFSHNVVLQL